MALNPAESTIVSSGSPSGLAETPVESPGAAVPRHQEHLWVWQVSGLSLVLGVMLALAVNTTTQARNATEGSDRFGVAASLLSRYKDRNDSLQSEVVKRRGQVKAAFAAMQDESSASTQQKQDFQNLQELAGRSAVSGSGIRITVRDSTAIPRIGEPSEGYAAYMVHDQDLNNILNDLKAAGVEHLGISGVDTTSIQRVVVTTTARCVGPTAVVNGTPLSAPYHIYAIGDRQLLRQYLERPDGYIRGPRQLDQRKMVAIEDVDEIALPEFASISARYAKPVASATK